MLETIQKAAVDVYHTDRILVAALNRLLAKCHTGTSWGTRGYKAYQQEWTPEAHLTRYLRQSAKSQRLMVKQKIMSEIALRYGIGDGGWKADD